MLHFKSKYLSVVFVLSKTVGLVLFLLTICTRVVFACMRVDFCDPDSTNIVPGAVSDNRIDWSLNVCGSGICHT